MTYLASIMLAVSFTGAPARAASLFSPFTLSNMNADGSIDILADGTSFILTGGNNGSGLPGTTDFGTTATAAGSLLFSWSYNSNDDPFYDSAGFFLGDIRITLSDTNGESGMFTLSFGAGDAYGWWVDTIDNSFQPGILSVTAQQSDVTATPEPGGFVPALLVLLPMALGAWKKSARYRRVALTTRAGQGVASALVGLVAMSPAAFGQTQGHYVPSSVTGQLTLVRTTTPPLAAAQTFRTFAASAQSAGPEVPKLPSVFPHPPLARFSTFATAASPAAVSLPVVPFAGAAGFNGLSHFDQRSANSGNQFSVEPPNPSIAAANGLVLEGVNNAVQIYTQSGAQLLQTISSNELFGLAPAINRNTGANGVYPTDMRVYFDNDVSRWFVIQRSQDNDLDGNPLNRSHLYMAVTQTPDPLGTWNIYVMDTTDAANPGCPCVPDFPQIGSDKYGFYISANEYSTDSLSLVNSIVLAISKKALSQSALAPPAWQFRIPLSTGYEFALQPATTPLGASNFLANGGVEYFVSSQAFFAVDNRLGIWALSNSASLDSLNPALLLTQGTVPVNSYIYPGVANQRPGSIPYGASQGQGLSLIDGNPDSRVLSVSYAGGTLFVTLPSQVTDDTGVSRVGGLVVILSPTVRNSVVAATVLKQAYMSVRNNHILRPSVAVNAQGRGAIAFTLVGADYYPAAAFSVVDANTLPASVSIVAAGTGPEDGFTGYYPSFTAPIARWGDYSTAVAGTDGSIWMVSEYIPNSPRTELANWGTFVSQYVP